MPRISADRRLPGAALDGRLRGHARLAGDLARGVARCGLVVGVQRVEKAHQGRGFRGRKSAAVCGHIAAAEQNLANHLVFSESGGDIIECRAALTAEAADRMAVAALLLLQHVGALAFEWRAFEQDN